jgi:hypothetical protein
MLQLNPKIGDETSTSNLSVDRDTANVDTSIKLFRKLCVREDTPPLLSNKSVNQGSCDKTSKETYKIIEKNASKANLTFTPLRVRIGNPFSDFLYPDDVEGSKGEVGDIDRKTSLKHSFFNNPYKSDVTFVLGKPDQPKIRVPGHSLIVGLASSVFEQLFENEWKELREIVIDVEASPFMSILRFIYCDEIVIEVEFVLAILLLCQKFQLNNLVDVLVKHGEFFVRDHIWDVLKWAHDNSKNDVWSTCVHILDKNAEELLTSDDFSDVSFELLFKIIRRSQLQIKETKLFYACVKWAIKRCEEKEVDASPENIRKEMEPFIKFIRFPLMNQSDFDGEVVATGILTWEECYKILLAIHGTSREKDTCGFNWNKRELDLKGNKSERSSSNQLKNGATKKSGVNYHAKKNGNWHPGQFQSRLRPQQGWIPRYPPSMPPHPMFDPYYGVTSRSVQRPQLWVPNNKGNRKN